MLYNIDMKYEDIKANLVNVYDQHAEQRDKRKIDDWKGLERAHFLDVLLKERKRNMIEIGAGPGRDSLYFMKQGIEVTGIDLSPKMVELCLQKGVDARVMDMVHLDFEHASFDAAYSLNSLLHLPKAKFQVALENVHKVLRPQGLFFLGLYGGIEFEGIWEKDGYSPKRFFSFHTDENLKKYLAGFFEIVNFKRVDLGKDQLHFQAAVLRKQ